MEGGSRHTAVDAVFMRFQKVQADAPCLKQFFRFENSQLPVENEKF